MTLPLAESTGCFTALSKETGEDLKLAMQRLWLTGKVTPFGARLLVEHTFESAEEGPVEVVYAFMLPQDAALRSFRVVGKGFEVSSDLQPVKKAVDLYEEAIDIGSLAVLARQYRDGMMNLTVGNLQPGETVRVILEILAGVERHDDGFRFRFPFTLAPAYHSDMRTASIPGGGEIELPRERFGDLILPPWKRDTDNLHAVGFDLELVGGQDLSTVISPSHGIAVAGQGMDRRVGMAVEADVPNRDLVLEAKSEEPWGVAWSSEGSVSALLGSTRFGKPAEEGPRRIVFVLDRSGSMAGKPITQARKAIEAGIAALQPADQFSIVAFDHEVESMSRGLLDGSDKGRRQARKFLSGIDARGGTELAQGVAAAADIFNKGGGDLLLLTDGQVFDTEVILETARKAGVRIHTLGIGSASQDRFLSQVGRETGGQCRFLTARERVDLALLDLSAGISPAVASEVAVQAGGETLLTGDVYPGQPVLVGGEGGGTELSAVWAEGDLEFPLVEAPGELGKMLWLLHGAASITQAESRITGEPKGKDASELEALSRKYGLASRVMALVAVVKRDSDKAGELPQTRVVPVGMPQDLSMDAYFGMSGQISHSLGIGGGTIGSISNLEQELALARQINVSFDRAPRQKRRGILPFLKDKFSSPPSPPIRATQFAGVVEEDSLIEDASKLEADGGMPGVSLENRIIASLDLLERLLDDGSTRARGPFRHHVRRLLEFLADVLLTERQREHLADLVIRAES